MQEIRHPDIAILIVNYKTKKYILDLLDSYILYENYIGKAHFYIGDNDSGENLEDLASLFPELSIRIYQIPENRGFGAGNNFLFGKTREDIIFLVNPDILWYIPVIEGLVNTLSSKKTCVVGPRLLTGKGNTQIWDHGVLGGVWTTILGSIGNSYWKEEKNIVPVSWVSGAAFMIRRHVFRDMGGFDEDFFLYREEEDLCMRIRKVGGNIYYNPSISLTHIGGVVSSPTCYAIESHNLYLKKHYPFLYKIGISVFLLKLYYRFFS